MSTLGGSRGERHAKPKFAALDINRLYKSSRGESLEPSTQKSQVPRKHGMQSLGKVPSTRRPPANLPSLKAETQSPGSTATGQDQSGNQGSIGGTNSGQTAQATLNSSTSSNNSINNSQTTHQISLQSSSTNSSLSVNSSGAHLSYSSSSSTSSASVTWSSVTTGNDGGGSLPPLYQSPQFQHEFPSLDGSVPSSSHKSHQKDTQNQHQQQQHQYGIRDRDGNGGNGVGENSKVGQQQQNKSYQSSGDVQQQQQHQQQQQQQVNLRPQTDALNWTQQQQQQQSGGGKGGDSHGNQQGQGPPIQSVPPQFRALMPPFMYRGSGTPVAGGSTEMVGNGARSTTPPAQQQYSSGNNSGGGNGSTQNYSQQNQNQQNGNFSMIQGRTRHSQQPLQAGQKDYRTNSPNTTSYQQQQQDRFVSSNNPTAIQKRPLQSGMGVGVVRGAPRSDHPDMANSLPYVEPEVAMMQRPIIKEEDLERIDSISKDDGWTRQDEIDYNKKLVFSDDEASESPGAELIAMRQQSRNEKIIAEKKNNNRHTSEEDNRTAWAREREQKERLERENIERERNERNEREHSNRPVILENKVERDRDRDRDRGERENRERDRDNRTPSISSRQQNGHRGLDPVVFERMKQRKEEEEKQEYERKQAAAKKKQELEMKMNTKKNEEDFDDSVKHPPNDDDYLPSPRMVTGSSRNYRDTKDNRSTGDRDYGRYEKYERDVNQRERDYSFKDGYGSSGGNNAGVGPPGRNGGSGGNKAPFSAHFQSNLPPRFLRQQQERNSGSGNENSRTGLSSSSSSGGPINSGSNNTNNRSITANHQQTPSHHYHHGSESNQQKQGQYDSRYIHSQNYKQQQQLRRNASDDMSVISKRSSNDGSGFNINSSSSSQMSKRRGADSEEDDHFNTSGRESISRNSTLNELPPQPQRTITPQLARSISDSSQRKMSASSSEEQQQKSAENCSLSQRSDSRDFNTPIGSWAAETDAEMKARRESSSSEHNTSTSKHDNSMDDCQPKQILQRPQRLLSSDESSNHHQRLSESSVSSKKDEIKSTSDMDSKKDESSKSQTVCVPTQILRRSESPKAWSESVVEEQESKGNEKTVTNTVHKESSSTKEQSNMEPGMKKIEPLSAENKISNEKQSEEKKEISAESSNVTSQSKKETGSDEKHSEGHLSKSHGQKRPSPRGGRSDNRGPLSRGYGGGMYRSGGGGGGGGSWSRRGGGMRMGGGGGRNYNDHFSESEISDDMDGDYSRRSDRAKIPRKESKSDQGSNRGHQALSKEGFAPRGEPSRRGRGGSSSGGSSYRNRGSISSSSSKRIDSYGASSNSKNSYNSGSTNVTTSGNSSHDDKGEKHDRKQEFTTATVKTEDKTKLNQMALSAGLSAKKHLSENADDVKDKNKPLLLSQQPLPKREDKKPSPPKSFGGSNQYHHHSQVSRKEVGGSSKTDNQQSDNKTHSITKKDDDNDKCGKDIPSQAAEVERKKSLSKEKEIGPNHHHHHHHQQQPAPTQQTQRSNSSGHISQNSRSSSHLKKDDRISQKSMTKPPPGLGFKQSSNLGQQGNSSNSQHKEQPLMKSKSSGDSRVERNERCDRDRGRGDSSKNNLPPRLVKQWENRRRDGNDINLSQSQHSTDTRHSSNNTSTWDKQLPGGQDNNSNKTGQSRDSDIISHGQQQSSTSLTSQQQTNSSSDSKLNSTSVQKIDTSSSKSVSVLDGSSAPVNTIIFENTNYKTVQAPVKRQVSNQNDSSQNSQQKKQGDEIFKSQSTSSIQDIQQAQLQQTQQSQPHQHQQSQQQTQQSQQQQQMHQQQTQQQEAITTALSQMSFSKAPESDYDKDTMKLGFAFDTEFTHLTDDKNSAAAKAAAASLCLPRSSSVMHSGTSGTQSTTADLNMKIASVKKVWENVSPMPTVLEHSAVPPTDSETHLASNFVTSQHQQHLPHFAAAAAHSGNIHMQHTLSSSGPPSYANTFDPNLDQHFGNKDGVVGSTTNTANETEAGGYSSSPQHVVGPQSQHQNNAQSNLGLKHSSDTLSSNNGNVCKIKPSQQQMHQSGGLGLSPPPAMQQGTTQLHQAAAPQPYYQPSQFGAMPTIPSPPAVLFNSSPMPSQTGLYAPFQIEAGRSQFSQFPGHYGTAGSAGPYSAYMQTPPNMQTAPAPDMYSSLTSQFRMSGAVQTPFNQSQQLNNPNTVLISSSSNSLMSASVKPSSQPIGAIGSKSNAAAAASIGQPYGQGYMNLYPPQQAPPPLQSNSYYSNSAGGQGAAFFGGPTAAAGATQGYGLQAAAAGIFGGHGGPAPSNAPPQQQIANFSSQFINSSLLTAAAINQFRGGPNPQTAQAYMKSNQGQNHMQDSMGRQLKSPLGTDVSLNLAKQVQPQQSPPHHKNYAPSWDLQNQVMQQQQVQSQSSGNRSGGGPNNMTGGPGGRPGQGGGPTRYPAPIQRPTNYPPHQPQSVSQSQRSVRQQPHSNNGPQGSSGGGGPINKHYYGNSGNTGGRGGHSSNPGDQNKQNNEKTIDSSSVQQDLNIKEDNSND